MEAGLLKYGIANIVVSGDFGYEVDLWKIAQGEEGAKYNPEGRFPGLTMKVSGKTIILFPKGKFILTGVKDLSEMAMLAKTIEKVCKKYKIG
jgi:TATA-box binding protein (TBP) (component of TFIID and TFIIIB)